MNIQETFISLTDYTYCLGDEHLLLDRLPKGVTEDKTGNYFLKIGETETMFCCHLDTAAFEKEKVVHDIFQTKKGDIGIGTDGSTILGADDKAGVVILLNLIENNIPGLYYFFIGEESGTVGSRGLLKEQGDNLSKYKRCIAFDRRDYGSVITKQMGRTCCSSEFADALIAQFDSNGMKYKQDPFGIYTDSAIFVDIIPECTNISVGYFHEHSSIEVQNITYLEELAKATVGIKWEELPTVRSPKMLDTPNPTRRAKMQGDMDDEDLEAIFLDVDEIMEMILHVYCFNYDSFMPEKEMIYIDYYDEDKRYSVTIHEDGSISIGKNTFDTYQDFVAAMKTYYGYKPGVKTTFNSRDVDARNFSSDDEDDANEDEFGNFVGDDEPPWHTDNETIDDEELVTLGSTFTKGLDIQDFIFDIINLTYDKGRNYLTVQEVNNLLESKNKRIDAFIMWLYDRDNNPDRTYGLKWDDVKNRLIVDDDGVE